ncbi:MAG: hypothetical protein K0U74_07990 [Alphaproteobacteria bacterium]|nr:hypothetical protein [Alphaproteobacteria bacterium]
MTTTAIDLYKALVRAGVDEDTARVVSEEVTGRNEDIRVLTARVNMLIAMNTAAFVGVVLLLLERLI